MKFRKVVKDPIKLKNPLYGNKDGHRTVSAVLIAYNFDEENRRKDNICIFYNKIKNASFEPSPLFSFDDKKSYSLEKIDC